MKQFNLTQLFKRSTKGLLVVLASCALAFSAQAHTVAFYAVDECDGSTTFYAETYHAHPSQSGLYGGLIVDGVRYNFTSSVSSTPAGADLIGRWRSRSTSHRFQVVNITLSSGSHTITTTRTSAVEAPWSRGTMSWTNTPSSEIEVDVTSDVSTVYYGYAPNECATLSATATGGSGSNTWSWSSGGSGSSETVCPTTTTTFTATVTDGNGCTASGEVTVDVVDVHCGKKGDKVEVCKVPKGNNSNAHTICVAASAVPSHLKNGSTLGACQSMSKFNSFNQELPEAIDVTTYPNPFNDNLTIQFQAIADEHVKIEAFDLFGKSIKVLFDEDVETSVYYDGGYNATDMPEGMIFIRFTSESTTKVVKVRHIK